MKTINLFEAPEGASRYHRTLAELYEKLEVENARVYRTHAWTGHHEESGGFLNFTFVTTSKDVHLALGRFSLDELQCLGYLVEDAFTPDDIHVMIRPDKKSNRKLLFSRSAAGVDVTYTVSVAQ